MTNFGTIYRGITDDGAFTLWAFGSTSAVDTALDFDTHFNDAGHFPAAAFKFTSLVLAGNPTIDLSNGGVTNLGLISVGDITSGMPGGTLTFTGLDALLLASQDGSISLGSEITFQDIPTLFFYARGTNGDLTLTSPIVGTTDLFLYAGRNITFNAGTDLILGGMLSTRTAGGNISVSEPGDISIGGSLSATTDVIANAATGGDITFTAGGSFSASTVDVQATVEPGVTLNDGANLTLNISGDLVTTSGDATFTIQNTTGTITNGGNITLSVDGSVSTQGQLSLVVENYDESGNPAGHIGTGGNISVTTGGDLTADSISAVVNNRNGGTIGSAASLTLNVGGALTTLEDGTDYFGFASSLSLYISNRYENTLGSTIGGNATLALNADSANIGGNLNALISDRGGTIDGNALLNFSVTNDVTVQGDAAWQILNDSGTDLNAASPIGGTIHGSANLLLSATNLTVTAGLLDVEIFNKNGGVPGSGGTIDSDANITFTLTGDLTTQSAAYFQILNHVQPGGTTGGTIGGDATINVTAANISTGVDSFGSSLDGLINNATGSIGGDAIVNVDVTNDITAQGPANFTIDNSNGGSIGGTTNVAVNVTNDVTAAGGVTLQILNGNGGHIGTGAAGDGVFYSVGGATSTTDLVLYVDSSAGGVIDNGGNVTLHTVGPVMLDGALGLEVDNFDGGTINNGANVTAHFVGDVTDTVGDFHSLNFFVINGSGFFTPTATGGTIGTGGNIDVTFDGNASTTGTLTTGSIAAEIFNGAGGSIGTGGNISMTVGGNLTAGPLFLITENQGGHLGTGGNMTLDVSGDITTQGDANFQIFNNDNGSGPGTIDLDATINVTAANISSGGSLFDDIFNSGGVIGGNTTISANVADVSLAGALVEVISNFGGNIVGGAFIINTSAGTVTLGTTDLNIGIDNTSGSIGGTASIVFDATGDINQTNGNTFFQILNNLSGDVSPSIGNDATVFVSGANILTSGQLAFGVENNGGSIGGDAILDVTAGSNITGANTFFQILNSSGTIAGDATIEVFTTNLSVDGLNVNIDNSNGVIGGNATVDMNVSGSATVTNDATFDILGSDGAAAAAINFNGGSYDAGGTFLALIDGNGTITFNNASAHADVLKVGALGTNGVLNIGGGTLSADTTLELYASGSNGQLNFVSNVTLGGNGAKILAANSVKIFDSVVVTIGGSNPADVYTNNANYSKKWGGNGTTTGTFAGAGANDPQPLSSAPPFGPSSPAPAPTPVASSSNITSSGKGGGKAIGTAINISSSDQLLSLLDGAALGPGGKITIPGSKIASNWRNSTRLNAASLLRRDRGAAEFRTGSSLSVRRLPQ